MLIKIPILETIKQAFKTLPKDLKKVLSIKTILALIVISIPIAYWVFENFELSQILESLTMLNSILIFSLLLMILISYNLYILELDIDKNKLEEKNLLKFCLYYVFTIAFGGATGFVANIFLAKPNFIVPPFILHKEKGKETLEILENYDKEFINIRIILINLIMISIPFLLIPVIAIIVGALVYFDLKSIVYILMIAGIVVISTLQTRLSLIVYSYFRPLEKN